MGGGGGGVIVLFCFVYLLTVCPKEKIYLHIMAKVRKGNIGHNKKSAT